MRSSLKRKLVFLFIVFSSFVLLGLGCKGGSREAQEALEKQVTLQFWGVFDSQDAYVDIIKQYQQSRPNVSIQYRKLQFAEYERALLDAWAEGRGPDVFMIHNTWVGSYENKIKPLPEILRLPTVKITGTIKKQKTVVLGDFPTISPREIKDKFISVVFQDAIRNNKIYALPLAVDTLALYYNRKLLDQAGVVIIPRTWQDIVEATKRITRVNEDGTLARSGVALGGTSNINRSFDIISLLMAQNGTQFFDASGRSRIAGPSPFSADQEFRPGQEALRFYTDFANSSKETFTWSHNLPNAFESFISGRLAMMFGYAYELPALRTQGPKIDFGIAPAPHINTDGTDVGGTAINWANYWMLTVAQASENTDEAWDFIQFATTKQDIAKKYLSITNKPTALRHLVSEQLADPILGVFAQQLPTAQSWYRGRNIGAVEEAFSEMIETTASGQNSLKEAVRRAEDIVNLTL